MQTTPLSLLEKLKQPSAHEAWARFVRLYTPLFYRWARRLGLQPDDAGDLVQEVFTTLVQKLPSFSYNPDKRFRGWLWTVLINKLRQRKRRSRIPVVCADSPEPAGPDEADLFAEQEYRHYVVGRALQLMQSEFKPATWKAFWEHAVNGRPAPSVGAELGLSAGAVYAAKIRVLAKLRTELQGLLD